MLVISAVLFISTIASVKPDAVELKLGVYNEIPDVNDDNLQSYKNMIETGYNNSDHTVNAVVNSSYDPYGNLTKYIVDDSYDLLEIDTISLPDLVRNNLVVSFDSLINVTDVFAGAAEASKVNGVFYAYPTLVCGNFIISMYPGIMGLYNLTYAKKNYDTFHSTLAQCNNTLLSSIPSYQRLLGGQMNDEYGYYLPALYIDGYIDIYGNNTAQQAIDAVLNGTVDIELCQRLEWYIGVCRDKDGPYTQNKCYYDYSGSYVNDSSNVYTDIANSEAPFYFGYSEKLAIIQQIPDKVGQHAISGPLGSTNILLMFTDSLVISKESWNNADSDKKNDILDFVSYYTSLTLRENITLGVDLTPTQKRYLLQANVFVYSDSQLQNDYIYQELYSSLLTGVPIPYMTDRDRETVEDVLETKCVQLSIPRPGIMPRRGNRGRMGRRGRRGRDNGRNIRLDPGKDEL